MKIFRILLQLLFIMLLVGSCSRKKNTFINRNWHAVTAEYNTLFNGNTALELGIEEMNQAYRDNFWEVLPVERLEIRDAVIPPGEVANPNFRLAEEKAIKAIQKHSMLIEGAEHNPQIDEAYVLLGKARYFDQRFIPALEAFNYVLHKYPLSNSITEARIWREKANIRLEFEEVAIENLKEILEDEDLQQQEAADTYATLAQAYMNLGEEDSIFVPLTRAAELTKKEKEEGRYWFILGQLYSRRADKEMAAAAFDRVLALKRSTPKAYSIHAELEKIRQHIAPADPKNAMLEQLMNLAAKRENRPFLDKIYFELAQVHQDRDSLDLAVRYYNRSLQAATENPPLQSFDYEALGNIHFDAGLYEIAGAYYDSTLQILNPNTRVYRSISRKRENLDDVIFYENLASRADSILYIAGLSADQQRDFFQRYTDSLKANAPVAEESNRGLSQDEIYFNDNRAGVPGVPVPSNTFYFYNPSAVAYGKQAFFRTWGERRLIDNWRNENVMDREQSLSSESKEEILDQNPKYQPSYYLERIPKEQAELDSLQQDLTFASYQLGLIYKEKFHLYPEAAERLEYVLAQNPEDQLRLPATYHLYKIYLEMDRPARAASLKNDIIHGYPDSRYAEILQEKISDNPDDPQRRYEKIYRLFQEERFDEVIVEASELISSAPGDQVVPETELLKALAEGRLYGIQRYRQGLDYVLLNYPRTDQAEMAQTLLEELSEMPLQYQTSGPQESYKLIVMIPDDSGMEEELKKLEVGKREWSRDVFSTDASFLVIHDFSSSSEASEFLGEFPMKEHSFIISSENYPILQMTKDLAAYLKWSNQEIQAMSHHE